MSGNLRKIGCGITCFLMVITLILSIIGTAGPQMYGSYGSYPQDETVTENWYLYKYIATIEEQSTHTGLKEGNVPCRTIYHKYSAAFAFAILSCIGGAIAVGVSIWSFRRPKIPLGPMFWSIVANFALLTIAWPISESVRTSNNCSHMRYSPLDAGYRMDYGLSLLIAAWCVSGAAAVIAAIFLSR